MCPLRRSGARRLALSMRSLGGRARPCARLGLAPARRVGPVALAPFGAGPGGRGVGWSLPVPLAGSRPAFRRSRRRWAGGSWVLWCFLGVSCGRLLFRSFRVVRAAFRSFRVRALGRFRPGRFVPPLGARPLWRRRGRAVRFGPCCGCVRAVVVPPPAPRVSRLRGASRAARGGRPAVVGRFRPGRAAARAGSPGWRFAPPGRRVRRSLRCGRLVVAGLLAVFAAGLPAACFARPAPGLPGVVWVACPSRLAAGGASRRARWLGLRVLACGPRGAGWLVAVALPLAPRPCPLSRRLAEFAPGGAPALPGLPLPVPPRGGFSRSPSRSIPAVSFHQGRLF